MTYDRDRELDLDEPDDDDDDDELRLLRDFDRLGDRLRERLRAALGERERRAAGDLPRDLLYAPQCMCVCVRVCVWVCVCVCQCVSVSKWQEDTNVGEVHACRQLQKDEMFQAIEFL